jgi:hypothetical protein
MELFEIAEKVKNKEDFVIFLKALSEDFLNNNEEWENPELGRYLDAMEAFLDSSTDQSISKIDFTPTWRLFAEIMLTARIYE